MCRKSGTILTDSSAGNVVPYVDPVCDIMIMAWLIESQAELSLVGNVVDDGHIGDATFKEFDTNKDNILIDLR